MVEEITLSKLDDVAWGFRMTGGLDFGTPLTIIKVSGGSISEQAGLRVGDMIFGLNGQSLVQVTHKGAHEAILQAGNCLTLSILRGSLLLSSPKDLLQNEQVTSQTEVQDEQKDLSTVPEEEHETSKSVEGESVLESSDIEVQANQEQEGNIIAPEDKIEEKEVAPEDKIEEREVALAEAQESSENITSEMCQGEKLTQLEPIQAEQEPKVLENVNEPKPEIHPLTEEELEDLMLGRAEVVGGKAIGVDFYKFEPKCEILDQSEVLQVLKDEKCDELEKKATTFLQIPQRPKVKPKKEDSPKPIPYKPVIKIPKKGQANEPNEENDTNDYANIEDIAQNSDKPESDEERGTKSCEKEELEVVSEVEQAHDGEEVQVNDGTEDTDQLVSEVPDEVVKPETVEDRIAQIQNQLATIMTLPAEIQQHLSKVQQELADILKVHMQTELCPEEEVILQQNDPDEEDNEKSGLNNEEEESEITKDDQVIPSETEVVSELEIQTDECENLITSAIDIPEKSNLEEETNAEECESPQEKHKKDIQWYPEPPKKNPPFFPLTPQPRPLRLPGGKKLWQTKVNFDDAFIAETLSGNAEIIKGTTIGVNFHKFEKNYEHLRASPVYKMIHSEDKLRGGFKNRSKALPAESDYYKKDETQDLQTQ